MFDRNCHLLVGHLGDFKGWNPDVVAQAPVLSRMLWQNRIRVKSGPEDGCDE